VHYLVYKIQCVKLIFKNNYAVLDYRGVGRGGYKIKYKINVSKLIVCIKDRKQEWECVPNCYLECHIYFRETCCFNLYTSLLLRCNYIVIKDLL